MHFLHYFVIAVQIVHKIRSVLYTLIRLDEV